MVITNGGLMFELNLYGIEISLCDSSIIRQLCLN